MHLRYTLLGIFWFNFRFKLDSANQPRLPIDSDGSLISDDPITIILDSDNGLIGETEIKFAQNLSALTLLNAENNRNIALQQKKIEDDVSANATNIGTLANLTTVDKSNLVNAINEVAATLVQTSTTITTFGANASYSSGFNSIVKTGKVVTLLLFVDVDATIAGGEHIFTIPAGFRPVETFNAHIVPLSGGSTPDYQNYYCNINSATGVFINNTATTLVSGDVIPLSLTWVTS